MIAMIVAVLTTVDARRIRMNVGVNRPKQQRRGKMKLIQEDYKTPMDINEKSRKGNTLNARHRKVGEEMGPLGGASHDGGCRRYFDK